MSSRRAIFLAILAALLFGTGLVLVYSGRYQHCSTEDVRFTASDGVTLNARLYLPKDVSGLTVTVDRAAPGAGASRGYSLFHLGPPAAFAATEPLSPSQAGEDEAGGTEGGAPLLLARRRIPRGSGLPAVVFTHGLLTCLEHYETAYSLEISKRGIAVLAIDYRGHGDSEGGLTDLPLFGMNRLTGQPRSQPDLIAAYDYVAGRPEIDPARIAFVGHSMGGFASTDAAMAMRDQIWATVAIGATPRYADVEYPLNFYLLDGARDEFFGPALALQAIAHATDGAVRREGVQFGRFEDGTARRLDLLPRVNHMTEVFSPVAVRSAIRWLESAFYGEPRGEADLTILPRLAGVGLIILGIVVGFVPCLVWTEKLCLGPAPPAAGPRTDIARRRARRRAAGLTVLYLLGWSSAPVVGGFLFFGLLPLRWSPILFAGPILALLYGGALSLLALGMLVRTLSGFTLDGPRSTPRGGPAESARPGARVEPSLPRRLAFGLIPFLYVFVAANLGLDRHFMDYWPTAQKWAQMAMLAPLLALPIAVNEWWLRRWIIPLSASLAAAFLVPIGTLSCFYLILRVLPPMQLGLVAIALSFFMGIMALSIAYARPSVGRRVMLGPWLFHVLTASWLLAIHLPPR